MAFRLWFVGLANMALQSFPVDLPWYAERGSFSEVPESNRSEFKPTVGRAKRSRASSSATTLIKFTMKYSEAQVNALLLWYSDTLGDGSDDVGPVQNPGRPATTIQRFQFVDEPSSDDIGFDAYRVAISIRKIF